MSEVLNGRWVRRKMYKRGNIWMGHVRDIRSGKSYRFSTTKTRKTWAAQAVVDWIRERERREEGEVIGDVAFGDAYIQFLGEKDVCASTESDYRRQSKIYREFFKGTAVRDIREVDVRNLLRSRGDIKPKTQRKYVQELRCFMQWCMHEDRLFADRDPTRAIKIRRPQRRIGNPLSFDEAGRLLRAAREPVISERKPKPGGRKKRDWLQTNQPPPHLHLALLIGFYTGLRRGTIFALRWRHVNLSRSRIELPAEMMKAGDDFWCPLHPVLEGALRMELRRQGEARPDGPVIGVDESKRALRTACGRADLPSIGWHDLRRSFASWLGTEVPHLVLKSLMSHSPGDVTGLYVTVAWEKKVAAIGLLPDLTAIIEETKVDTVARG